MKQQLVAQLIASLRGEIERATRQAKDAAEGVTHADNKPEGDKDMRSTEASYIARGQAARVTDTVDALARLEAMPIKKFAEGARIEASALVDVELDGTNATTFLIVPAAGGRTLEHGDARVTTLATTSPLGRALLGLTEGQDAEVQTPQGLRTHSILRVR